MGLIIAEATQVSPTAQGYPSTPGLHTAEQVAGWRKVTEAVHAKGGKIFVQLWHVGRMSHTAYQPDGQAPVAPSAIAAKAKTFVAGQGMVDCSVPRALETAEIAGVVNDFRTAARNAIEAGFDGVEIHGAHGYLLDAFLRDGSNHRTDQYGGSIENRARFLLEVMAAVTTEIGADRVGIRLSPHGVFNGTGAYADVQAQYVDLVTELSKLELLYVHLLDHSAMGAPPVPPELKATLRACFNGPLILAGGFDGASAEAALAAKQADLIAFGRPFLANPDLVARLRSNAALNAPDMSTFYTPGEKGYTDYPALPS